MTNSEMFYAYTLTIFFLNSKSGKSLPGHLPDGFLGSRSLVWPLSDYLAAYLLFGLPSLISSLVLGNYLMLLFLTISRFCHEHLVPLLQVGVVLTFQVVEILFKSGELTF